MRRDESRILKVGDCTSQVQQDLASWLHEYGSVWQSPAYQRVVVSVTESLDESLIAVNSQSEIVGYLPIMVRDGSVGKVGNSLPFFGTHGNVMALNPEVYRRLLQEAAARVERRELTSLTLIDDPFADSRLVARPPSDLFPQTDYRLGQWTKLQTTGRALIDRLHPKIRYGIRKSHADALRIERDPAAFEALPAHHARHMEQIGGEAKPARFFHALVKEMSQGDDFDVWLSRSSNGQIQAMLLVLYLKGTAEYFMPTWDRQGDHPFALHGLIFAAMTAAAHERGCTTWNWGGTWPSQDGVFRFKQRWDSETSEYAYRTLVHSDFSVEAARSARENGEYQGFYLTPWFGSATRTAG